MPSIELTEQDRQSIRDFMKVVVEAVGHNAEPAAWQGAPVRHADPKAVLLSARRPALRTLTPNVRLSLLEEVLSRPQVAVNQTSRATPTFLPPRPPATQGHWGHRRDRRPEPSAPSETKSRIRMQPDDGRIHSTFPPHIAVGWLFAMTRSEYLDAVAPDAPIRATNTGYVAAAIAQLSSASYDLASIIVLEDQNTRLPSETADIRSANLVRRDAKAAIPVDKLAVDLRRICEDTTSPSGIEKTLATGKDSLPGGR